MAKHKAPTQITIASTTDQTSFHLFVERYWKLGAFLAVVGTGAILFPKYQEQKAQQQQQGTWDDLRAQADLGSGIFGQIQGGPAEALALFADQHRDTAVGAWAKALEVGGLIQNDDLAGAEKAANQMSSLWPDHALNRMAVYPTEDGSRRTLSEAIRDGMVRMDAWEKEHAMLFSNPALPADAPRVRLNTSKGPIVVGLYMDRTPLHAENFLKRCRESAYDGTKFHKVVRGSLIQAGDPNTIAGEPETWGFGGPDEKIESEADPQLRHFKGALVAWKGLGEKNSHGSQFFLTTADQNHMDGQTIVFGVLLEGDSTVEAIESGAVVGDRPQDPVVIESVEIL